VFVLQAVKHSGDKLGRVTNRVHLPREDGAGAGTTQHL
jgi:hypothetical protein